MPGQTLELNILPFSHPVTDKNFGFFKEKKDGYAPLNRWEFPLSLWETYEDDLQDQKRLYTDSSTIEGSDYTATVDLSKSTNFATHYYKYLIQQHFANIADVVSRDFVGDIELWFHDTESDTQEYKTYQIFTIRVQIGRITNGPELILSYDGTSKVFVKSLLQLNDFPTEYFNRVIYNKRIYKYENLSPDIKNDLDQVYPILNNSLKTYLGIPFDIPSRENKYKPYRKRITEFFETYLKTEEFRAIIPVPDAFYKVKDENILKTKAESNSLLFGKGTDINPYTGMLNKGPCTPSRHNQVKFFFICPKDEYTKNGAAMKLYDYFINGIKSKYNGVEKVTFPTMLEFIKQNFNIEKDSTVKFESIDTLLDEVSAFLRQHERAKGVRYVAIYLSPVPKDDPDPVKKEIYYKLKELLLNHEITSQVIYKENISKKGFNFFLPNIETAILAKIDGVPWRLNREPKKELIVGVGAFYSYTQKARYVGSAFCFNNEGSFQGFECFTANQTDMLAGSIRKAVLKYVVEHEKAERLVIHFYKKISEEELKPIMEVLNKLGLQIPVYVITINKTESKDLVAFDISSSDLLPLSGTILPIGRDQYLLFNNTRYQTASNGSVKDWPFPIKLTFSASDNELLRDVLVIKELIDQVYQFSRMYWKSVKQQNLPVTIKYPEMVAEIFPHFEADTLPQFGKSNLWFL